MVQVSNSIITFNLVTLGFSLVCLWPLDEEFPCLKLLQTPLLILGASLLVVSLLGFVGFGWRVTFFMWLYLLLLFSLMLGLLCFSLFTIMVTNKNVSRALSGKNYKDLFELGDYSHWLQKYVVNSENWEEIKSCLVDTEYCQYLPTGKGVNFYKYSLSAMQSSCCQPPTYSGLEFHSATDWTMPKTGPVVRDNDCNIWSNVQTELCFNCQSCKTAFLDNIKKDWKQLFLINFGLFLLVLIVFCVGCCALRNNN